MSFGALKVSTEALQGIIETGINTARINRIVIRLLALGFITPSLLVFRSPVPLPNWSVVAEQNEMWDYTNKANKIVSRATIVRTLQPFLRVPSVFGEINPRSGRHCRVSVRG
jgi:hypothetical protein